jgi:hypothetical protein
MDPIQNKGDPLARRRSARRLLKRSGQRRKEKSVDDCSGRGKKDGCRGLRDPGPLGDGSHRDRRRDHKTIRVLHEDEVQPSARRAG